MLNRNDRLQEMAKKINEHGLRGLRKMFEDMNIENTYAVNDASRFKKLIPDEVKAAVLALANQSDNAPPQIGMAGAGLIDGKLSWETIKETAKKTVINKKGVCHLFAQLGAYSAMHWLWGNNIADWRIEIISASRKGNLTGAHTYVKLTLFNPQKNKSEDFIIDPWASAMQRDQSFSLYPVQFYPLDYLDNQAGDLKLTTIFSAANGRLDDDIKPANKDDIVAMDLTQGNRLIREYIQQIELLIDQLTLLKNKSANENEMLQKLTQAKNTLNSMNNDETLPAELFAENMLSLQPIIIAAKQMLAIPTDIASQPVIAQAPAATRSTLRIASTLAFAVLGAGLGVALIVSGVLAPLGIALFGLSTLTTSAILFGVTGALLGGGLGSTVGTAVAKIVTPPSQQQPSHLAHNNIHTTPPTSTASIRHLFPTITPNTTTTNPDKVQRISELRRSADALRAAIFHAPGGFFTRTSDVGALRHDALRDAALHHSRDSSQGPSRQ